MDRPVDLADYGSQLTLTERLFSIRIWNRRFQNYRLAIRDRIFNLINCLNRPFSIAIIGDLEHFRGSKLYKARYFNLVPGKKIEFVPFDENLDFDRIIKWEPFNRLPSTGVSRVINDRMGNINKLGIDQIHNEVFGRKLVIDPKTYDETFLEKDLGTTDGGGHSANHTSIYLHNTPIQTLNPSSVYVRLIDNSTDDGCFTDYRCYIVNKLVYPTCCQFDLSVRFATQSAGAQRKRLHDLEKIFSTNEIKEIQEFVSRLELDYGEIDVLRDRRSKEIYVVDVNNVPYGDFRKLGFKTNEIVDIYRSVLLA